MRVIAADVGGTKTLVALYEGAPGALVELARRRYESAAFEGVEPILSDFLGGVQGAIDAAALGIAGPVAEDTCKTTNLPWELDARRIERALGIPRARLLNDFEAVALGLGELDEGALEVLQDRPTDPSAPAVVLGAGTGLGEAILVPSAAGDALPSVHPTEGGHTDFAPRDEEEIALWRFLMERHGRVSVERVLSGRGLEAIYEHLVAQGAPTTPALARHLAEAEDRAAVIGEAGATGTDPACARAVARFVSIYGSEAGNFALKTLPFGGLYVAGGIAPKLIEVIRAGAFVQAFRAKEPMEAVLDRIRVSVVLDSCVGLYGARRVAVSLA